MNCAIYAIKSPINGKASRKLMNAAAMSSNAYQMLIKNPATALTIPINTIWNTFSPMV